MSTQPSEVLEEMDLIVNFAPTGMIPTKDMTPHVPVSVAEVVEDVHEALVTTVPGRACRTMCHASGALSATISPFPVAR